jgi:hypothetical protein
VNVEFSNEALAKAKSRELRSYRKAPRNASKKNSPLLEPGRLQVDRLLRKMPVRLGPMVETIAEGTKYQAAKPHLICQRVEDNAFHQLELPAVFPFR